jgi:uncharacterized protein YndB with AHSA1/START domain
MIWILVVAGGVAAVIAVIAAAGSLLPRAHVVTRSRTIARPPAEVWAVLADRAAYPTWRSGLARVEPLADRAGRTTFREHGKHGAITYVVDEAAAPTRLVTRIDDPTLPFGGRWIHELAADGAGTRVTVTEDGEVRNPIFRFLSRFVFGHTATLDGFLADLARRLEAS